MPARFLISSQTLSTAAASVTFSAIPATYTDLVLKMTTRMATGTFGEFSVQFNSDSSALYSDTILLYIPSYTASQSKPVSAASVTENNATTSYISANAGLYRSNTAISSITIIDNINSRSFASGSSFYLYGISKTN